MAKCRTCHELYSEFSDGWDGECPDCADRTWIASGEGVWLNEDQEVLDER